MTGAAPQSPAFERLVPGLRLIRSYRMSWLRFDVVAGVVLAAILVPQGMAYAELAGLPPVTGLYTTVACLVGYAVFGPSRVLVLGPDSSVSPLIFAAIAPLVVAGDDPGKAIALAGMLAVLVGAIEIGLGLGKLGFVAGLLSKEVQVGYMNGLGITIIVGQLPKLFGFSTDADGFVDELRQFFGDLSETHGTTLLVGIGVLLVLLVLPRFTNKVPAVLVAVVGATLLSAWLDLSAHGVAVTGVLPQGVPKPAVPWTSAADLGPLLLAAVGITLVSLTDTIATATSFAVRRGDEVDADQEMVGMGASNVVAGLFQGFAISTSGSRTAVAEQAGAKSQVTGLVGAGMVVLLLLLFNSLLADLPQSALAAVVIAAALSLMDLAALRGYARVRPSALVLSLVATIGVVLIGVLQGIVVAIALSILLFFKANWWPHGAVLGRVERSEAGPGGESADRAEGWHSVTHYPDGEQVPGVVVYRWEAPLFFANSAIFLAQVRHLVGDHDARWVVLQCEAVTDVDLTAADMLRRLDEELNQRGVHLAFVELRDRLRDLVFRYGLHDTLDRDHFYPTIEAALADIERLRVEEATATGDAVASEDATVTEGDRRPG
jgi:high affinity sulfate transporter 1